MKNVFRRMVVMILILCMSILPMDGLIDVAQATSNLVWPVPGHTALSQGFHNGSAIDISDGNIAGATIVAAMSGTVTYKFTCCEQHLNDGDCHGFGTGIVINGDDGRIYQYAHMQGGSIPSNVYVGARVSAGQKIGQVGTTGYSTGYHLHFGISIGKYWNQSGIDPSKENYASNDTTKPTISNVKVTNITSDGYTVTCNVSDNVGVTSVKFPSWNCDNGRDSMDCPWIDGTISGNVASARINISQTKTGAIEGNYLTHIYAYDAAGNSVCVGAPVTYVDRTKPVITDAKVIDKDSTGYTVQCKVTDNKGVNRVQCPTWTEKNDQDDIAKDWGTNASVKAKSMGNGVYQFRVNISDHNNEYGLYKTHIYAYDDCGNQTNSNLNHIEVVYMDIYTRYSGWAGKDAFVGYASIKTGNAKKFKSQQIITSAYKDGKKIEKVIDIPTDSYKAESSAAAFFIVDRRDFSNAKGKYTTTYIVEDVNGSVWKKSVTYDFDEYPDDVKIKLNVGDVYKIEDNLYLKELLENNTRRISGPIKGFHVNGTTEGSIEIDIDSKTVVAKKEGRAYFALNDLMHPGNTRIVIVDVIDDKEDNGENSKKENDVEKEPGTTEEQPKTTEKEPVTTEQVPTSKKLSVPNISSVSTKTTQATFNWNWVDGADGYEIEDSFNPDMSNSYKASWNYSIWTKNSGILTGLEDNKTYYYRIRAFAGEGNSRVYSEWTEVKSFTTKASSSTSSSTTEKTTSTTEVPKTSDTSELAITGLKVKSKKKGQMTVSWNKSYSVDGYQISYSRSMFFNNASSKRTSWINSSKKIKGLKKGKYYFVRIRGYKTDYYGDKVYGEWSNMKMVQIKKK